MDIHRVQHVLSILMESPLYLSLPLEERHALLERLAKCYPSVFEAMADDDSRDQRSDTSRSG